MLPKEPFEAVYVDGASSWRTFWDITFPMLLPVSIGAIVLRSIEAFKMFDIVFFITGGGPGNTTSTLTLSGYFTALRSGVMGYGAAMSVIMLLTVAITATIILTILRKVINKPNKAGQKALESFSEKTVAEEGI
jgi:multiple sugar transport system permease protein